MLALRTTGLGRRFGARWALAHVDLEIARGETVLLSGPNGSGKTTLLRLAAGLTAPSMGSIEVLGLEPVRHRGVLRPRLAMVSHALGLYPRMNARETLELWVRLGGAAGDAISLEAALADVGLAEVADLEVGGFSAGMRKRLALARARLSRPDMVLLDEPFAALDADGRGVVERWIRAWHAADVTVLIASHAVERCAPLVDRAIRLESGQVVRQGRGVDAVEWD